MKQKVYTYTSKEKKLVKETVDEFVERLHLQTWKFDLTFWDKDKRSQDGNGFVCAEIGADPVYMKGSVHFYPMLLKQKDTIGIGMFREMIMHELCHCLTETIGNIGKCRYVAESDLDDELEILTQKIAVLILNDKDKVKETKK